MKENEESDDEPLSRRDAPLVQERTVVVWAHQYRGLKGCGGTTL
jgi:hypothetical protein